jgi:hypothetical protein
MLEPLGLLVHIARMGMPGCNLLVVYVKESSITHHSNVRLGHSCLCNAH